MSSSLNSVTFGREAYRLASVEPSWYQESSETAAACDRCDATLTFCFANRLDPSIAGLAANSICPVAIRCDCMLAEQTMSSSPAHSDRLTRPPVMITPEPTLITPM
jgi:hypothetical protein